MFTVGLLVIYLMTIDSFIDATGTFYEEITESDGKTIYAESMHRSSLIHKSFHQCSMKETCNYVIKDIASGSFLLYNSEDDLPQNRTGLRIWKKIYFGKCCIKSNSLMRGKFCSSNMTFLRNIFKPFYSKCL